MTYQAILFDLDGTLLPMDLDQFTEGVLPSFGPDGCPRMAIGKRRWFRPCGRVWGAMVKNQGNRSNCEAFWETFAQVLGPQVYDHIPIFDAFYATEFSEGPGPLPAPIPELPRQWHWPGGRQSG